MRLYWRFVAMQWKSQLEYKASYIMTTLGQFLLSSTAFVGVYFMFDRFEEVDGFRFEEVLLTFAVVLMSFSAAELVARGFDVFPRLIRSGDLDRILLRPRSAVFQVLSSTFEFTKLGRFLQGLVVFVYALPRSGVTWTGDKVLTLCLMLVGGFVVFCSLFVLYAGISFFTIEGIEFMNIFTDGSREFAKYPVSIYGEGVLKFLTFVVPIALFQYYPLLYLVGRSTNRYLMLLPLVGVLFFVPCYLFFLFGMRRYQSTGS